MQTHYFKAQAAFESLMSFIAAMLL